MALAWQPQWVVDHSCDTQSESYNPMMVAKMNEVRVSITRVLHTDSFHHSQSVLVLLRMLNRLCFLNLSLGSWPQTHLHSSPLHHMACGQSTIFRTLHLAGRSTVGPGRQGRRIARLVRRPLHPSRSMRMLPPLTTAPRRATACSCQAHSER